MYLHLGIAKGEEGMTLTKKHYIKFLIYGYLIAKPFYFLNTPFQIADIILLALFFILLSKENEHCSISAGAKSSLHYYTCFMLWVILVNLAWFFVLGISKGFGLEAVNFFTNTVYYVFNGIAMIVILWAYGLLEEELARIFVKGCFLSCMFTVLCSFVLNNGGAERQTAGFSNPNQLAYYGVIVLTAGVLWGHLLEKKRLLLLVISALYLNFISLSKAGIISCLFLVALCLLCGRGMKNSGIFNHKVKLFCVLLGIFGLIALFLMEIVGNGNSILMRVIDRLLGMRNEKDSNLGSGRGYNRIFEMGTNFLWGMGEGGYDRFQIMNGKEIHSTFVSIYVCYGVVGLMLSVITMMKLVLCTRDWFFKLLSFSGIFLYCITHNGVRNTIVWMMFTLIAVSGQSNMEECTNE